MRPMITTTIPKTAKPMPELLVMGPECKTNLLKLALWRANFHKVGSAA
jgi:hypothetical protein